MSQSTRSISLIIFGILLSCSIAGAAFILGERIKHFQQPNIITVKGIAEEERKSTLGYWNVGISAWGKNYAEAIQINTEQIGTLVQFLMSQGFEKENFELMPIKVEEYIEPTSNGQGKNSSQSNGFYANRSIVVSTRDLNTLKMAFANIQELRSKNNTITFESPNYYLENIEDIKRELIIKAAQDAHKKAESFAKTANMSVGTLRSATQEAFEIESSHLESKNTLSSINKKVRLVTTVQYTVQ